MIAAMMDPAFYPGKPEDVEMEQTHISYVFLAGNKVYKVKKPVDFGFLNFSTLELRKHYCEEELKLNRRLAPDLYESVVPIMRGHDGAFFLGADGVCSDAEVVDYTVVMKRIRNDRLLKKLIFSPDFNPEVLSGVAEKLARFHSGAGTGGVIDAAGGLESIIKNHEENFEQVKPFIGVTIPGYCYDFIKRYAALFIKRNAALFDERRREGRIRDCHGDLHLDHIVVDGGDVTIYDCIEFNDRFRCADVAADVAFLAMDFDYNGKRDLAEIFVRDYIKFSGDQDIPKLIGFYKCYYAFVRGKVTGFKSEDKNLGGEDRRKAAEVAGRYFALSYSYAARPETPFIIVISGLMGTGKSLLAARLAEVFGARLIKLDSLRKQMIGDHPEDRHLEPFGKGIYSPEWSQKVYERARELAGYGISEGTTVLLDGSFKLGSERLSTARLAESLGANFLLVECVCSEDVIHARLDARMKAGTDPSDGRWELYHQQKAGFEKVVEIDPARYLVVDGGRPIHVCIHDVVERVFMLAGLKPATSHLHGSDADGKSHADG